MKHSSYLVISIFIPFCLAGITYFIIYHNADLYTTLLLPSNLTMPSYMYILLWELQYILFGYASYLICQIKHADTYKVLSIYGIQLLLLFLLPVTLFYLHAYLLSVIILFLSWGLHILMIYTFYKLYPLAGYILVLYFFWISYMLYYHFQIFMWN
jgi:tryptophan-rich sensory protein